MFWASLHFSSSLFQGGSYPFHHPHTFRLFLGLSVWMRYERMDPSMASSCLLSSSSLNLFWFLLFSSPGPQSQSLLRKKRPGEEKELVTAWQRKMNHLFVKEKWWFISQVLPAVTHDFLFHSPATISFLSLLSATFHKRLVCWRIENDKRNVVVGYWQRLVFHRNSTNKFLSFFFKGFVEFQERETG